MITSVLKGQDCSNPPSSLILRLATYRLARSMPPGELRVRMTFELRVSYKFPSKEWIFLGAGWGGVRDVRGAYISEPTAWLHIENWALSQKFPSKLILVFSMSHRAEVDAMVVRAIGSFGQSHVIIGKHQQASMTISPCLRDPVLNFARILLQPTFGPSNAISISGGTIDLVALDELKLLRECV